MKKWKRKLSVLVCAFLACAALFSPFSAGAEYACQDSLFVKMEGFIMENMESFGYDSVGNQDIFVGDPLYSYAYMGDESFLMAEYFLYPVFVDDALVMFAVVYDENQMELSQALSRELSCYVNTGEEIAVIYDSSACYIYEKAAGCIRLIYSFEESLEGRGVLDPAAKVPVTLETAELKPAERLMPRSVASPQYDPIAPTVILSVPYVTQLPYGNLCWAASTVMIGSYLTDKSYTVEDIAMYIYGKSSFNVTASLEITRYALKNKYGIEYNYYDNSTVPGFGTLYINLSNGYPVYAGWQMGSGKHMTVIRGIDHVHSKLYVADPACGYVVARKIDGKYQYTSTYSGFTLTLTGYLSYYA